MHNKKIIAKGLVFTTTVVNVPIDSLANTIEESKTINTEDNTKENKGESGIKKFFAKIVEPIEELMSEPKEVIKVNKNIVRGSVLEISLADGQFVQDLTDNPGRYETVRVTTTGSKKLVKQDYDNLRLSGISKIDLSNAYSDSIPVGAFSNATHLTEFKFPIGVTSISEGATAYYVGSFYNCVNLTGTLEMPDTVVTIGNYAFYGCNSLVGDLTIPNSVTTVGNAAFIGCSGFTGDLILPNSILSIGREAFSGCSGFTGNLTLPNTVENIAGYAFQGCSSFTGELVIPSSITKINHCVFKDCSGLESLVIPNSVESIGDSAFEGCSNLSGELIIPDSVTAIGNRCFKWCSKLTGDLILPNSIEELGGQTFYGCKGFSGNLILSNSLTAIWGDTFYGCSGFTGDLIIPNSVITIGSFAFYGCSGFNGSLAIGNSVVNIESQAFRGCNGLTGDLMIPDSVTTIGNHAFYQCRGFDGEIKMSNSIVSIGRYAFESCSNLIGSLIIPESITTIEEYAFGLCNNIEKIVVKLIPSDIETDYKKSIIDSLPDNVQTVIDISYDFDISGTWLETTNKTVGKPVIKNVINGIEGDLENDKGESVSLCIPSIYQESNISVLRDDKPYTLPKVNSEGKHIFTEPGIYQVTIITDLGNTSIVSFEVEDPIIKQIEENLKEMETVKDTQKISDTRELINSLPESMVKDQLQEQLNNIFPDIELEKKTVSANLDVYIKSENMLSLSLDTNSITFEEYSGAEPMEKLNAVNLTINSSLPYNLNAYMPTEISNSDGTEKIDIDILNIRESNEGAYKQFEDTTNKLILKENCQKGNNINHSIDLKLDSNDAHVADIYKTVIKFEAEQK